MLKWLRLSVFGLMVIANHAAYSELYLDQQIPLKLKHSYAQEKNTKDLFKEQGRLLNQMILTSLHDVPQNVVTALKTRLAANSRSIANIVGTVKGKEAAKTFETLLNQHASIAAQYIDAIKANDHEQAAKAFDEAIAGGRQTAKFLSDLSPSISYGTWERVFDHLVKIEAEQIKAYFQGNHGKAIQLRDQSISQSEEIADMVFSVLSGKP